MSSAVMMERIAEPSPRFKARTAGFFWLMTFLTGGFAMFVGGRFIVSGDAAAPAANVLANESSFRYEQGSNIAFAFFGLHCLLVGCLILKSTFLPRIVGALMVCAGLGWLTFSFTSLLSPPLARYLIPYIMAPGMLGEASLTLWLLVMGVNV